MTQRMPISLSERHKILIIAQALGAEMWDQPILFHVYMRFLFLPPLNSKQVAESAKTFEVVLRLLGYKTELYAKVYRDTDMAKKLSDIERYPFDSQGDVAFTVLDVYRPDLRNTRWL